MRICHPEIVREERVQRASHRWRCPPLRHAHSDRLASCVDAGVGAAGSKCRHRLRAELAERGLEHPLHGATIGLSLPSAEVRAVIVQHEQQHAGRHRSESYPEGGVCQANRDAARTRAQRGNRVRVIDFGGAARTTSRAAASRGDASPCWMPPRTLATLAHALSVASDVDAALLALAEALAEVDRFAQIALVRYDARREMLVDRLMASGDSVVAQRLDTTFRPPPDRASASRYRPDRRSWTSRTILTSSPRCSRSSATTTSAGSRCAVCGSKGSSPV
jgi:hypothetical protein